MNRRGFLAALAGAMVMDPERLLWVPGQKTISIPVRLNPRYHVPGQAYQDFLDAFFAETPLFTRLRLKEAWNGAVSEKYQWNGFE